jgi:hypothetical protein
MNKIETQRVQTEIFTRILVGGESNKLRAIELIRKLDAVGRRDLRAGIQTLDYLMDDVFLAERREKRIEKQKQ